MTAVLTAPAVVALFRDPQSAADLADPLASASSTLACRSKPMTYFRPGTASSSIGSSRCAKKRAMEKMPARWPPSSAPVAHEDHPQRRAMTQEQKVIRVKVGALELARFTLNGGTALNLFLFDVPRLSVDADLNYIGAQDRATMMAEREQVERASRALFAREDFRVQRVPSPDEHAGGKWRLRYRSPIGGEGDLEVDINFMFRVPLWPPEASDSRAPGFAQTRQIPVLNIHELAAGKLAALFSRRARRDLFDTRELLWRNDLNQTSLRTAFVATAQ